MVAEKTRKKKNYVNILNLIFGQHPKTEVGMEKQKEKKARFRLSMSEIQGFFAAFIIDARNVRYFV